MPLTTLPMPSQAPTAPSPKALHLQGGPHGVLLFHGLSSSPLELQFIARGIQRSGYTVWVPVIANYTYGLHSNQAKTVAQWLQGAIHELDQMLAFCTTVSIGGLCLGSVLALRVAELRPQSIAAVLALSTALHYDGWGNPWFTWLLPFARYTPRAGRIRIKERSPFGLKDERMRAWVAKQMREAGESDAGAATLRVADLLLARDLIALTRKSLQNITSPMLLLHAKEDECATPRSSFEVASGIQSTCVRLVLLRDCYHMISIDREKDRVLAEIVQFLAHDRNQNTGSSSPPGLISQLCTTKQR
jgi:carboxylesterase